MMAKKIVTVGLLAFVGISVACLVIQETPSGQTSQGESAPTETAKPASEAAHGVEPASAEPAGQIGHKLIAYYFHRTQRCRTCLKIEAFAEEALKEGFPKAWKTGEIAWHAVNYEEPANEHFIEEYELAASSLVLVDTHDGKQKEWRNLGRVWELVGDELKFKSYVEAEALMFMELSP